MTPPRDDGLTYRAVSAITDSMYRGMYRRVSRQRDEAIRGHLPEYIQAKLLRAPEPGDILVLIGIDEVPLSIDLRKVLGLPEGVTIAVFQDPNANAWVVKPDQQFTT